VRVIKFIYRIVSYINVEVQSAVVDISSSDSDALEEQDFEPGVELSLTEKLRLWVNENRVSQTATNRLLMLLVQYHPELPRHQRTLLRTATDIDDDKVAGGDFSYLSLRRVLPAVLKKARVTAQRLHDSNIEVKIQFNVDGVPVFNSVNYSMWPILGAVVSPFKSNVFTVAVYGGSSKPDDFNKYMQPLVDELQQLSADGGLFVEELGMAVEVKVENFCCDAPAKADLRMVKQFNARHGCERCNVSGTYMQHRMVLETENQETRLRHDDDFDIPLPDDKEDREEDEYRKQESVLHRIFAYE
jgi:hypothetical protein